MADIIFEML